MYNYLHLCMDVLDNVDSKNVHNLIHISNNLVWYGKCKMSEKVETLKRKKKTKCLKMYEKSFKKRLFPILYYTNQMEK